ncbi:ATP-binding cassette, subfamily B, MsbA [Halorientalis persicus]|uniref:ATP-binding cassette, subfamily B, MsbA n=1 Tax=Halorientalis persicus TaxID=1367881 RepID=A0A1H8W0J2_9EURY|nr:ABC transporter ATP-binding protein [Halorientalis persicus]SEP21110.1 ATP-binding cassette, subfamily B, MsbA [Halorientalis persicus]
MRTEQQEPDVGFNQKLAILRDAASFRPALGSVIIGLSIITALFEGIGVGFILPIIEFAQSSTPPTEADGVLQVFVQAYRFAGVPFTLEYLVAGVAVVMTFRYVTSFVVGWQRAILTTGYQREMRRRLFEALSYAPIEYIDQQGSDDLLNSLVTETRRTGSIISGTVSVLENALRGLIYLVIAAVLSPILTLIALVALSASSLFVRYVLEPAYSVGDDVADANTQFQTISQASIQGMRDVRLFNLRPELIDRMDKILDKFYQSNVKLSRNRTALSNLNQLSNALVVFGLIYIGIQFTSLSLAEIGVFLFAVYRLSPTVTQLNSLVYQLNSSLPHIVRVQNRIQELESMSHPAMDGTRAVTSVDTLTFEDVSFSYGQGEQVLQSVSFSVERGKHIAFVGQSGAGKSTIVSLVGRLQSPGSGRITADGTPIDRFDVEQWRDRLAVIRQNPYIFDETLKENITVGNRNASLRDIERVCEIAQVSEFIDELPDGYDTDLGEDGVRLSGGQKQRVAIARALLKDADILILDEATSDLDSNIEQRVHENITGMEDQYMMISIAHRLSTVSDADRIYTLIEGSITDVGTHEELLESEGIYADLYATQSQEMR